MTDRVAPDTDTLSRRLMASARCVQHVQEGRSLSDSLAQAPTAIRPAVQAISFFTMRRLAYVQAVRDMLVSRPPRHPQFNALLLVALALADAAVASTDSEDDAAPEYIGAPRYAPHTVVDQAVRCATQALRPWRGLLNGVLRRFLREHASIRAQVLRLDTARWNYPSWWIEKLRKAYPSQWQSVLLAGNVPAPMFLRVNRRRAEMAQVLASLEAAGIQARQVSDLGIHVLQPASVEKLPGFAEGWWSVQDIAAQRAASLLPLTDGMRVLDACAAPGGKTAHLLERANIELLALDHEPHRLQRVEQNLARLGLDGDHVRLQCADATALPAWWDGRPFDAVLADVPCTASGVVRRHPDIRWLRRPDDVDRTASLQSRIMDALWQTVACGGHLLYVTCSVFPEEGEQQAQAFARRHANARRLAAPGQVLPLYHDDIADAGDGFFYALFCRT